MVWQGVLINKGSERSVLKIKEILYLCYMNNTYVAIMAGGIGSRFWPESRKQHPKQFLDLLGTGDSLIKMTFDRYRKMVPAEHIYVITNNRYVDMCAEHLPEIPKENILAEPFRRNTAPCVAYIAYKLLAKNPYAKLIVAPSDHLITKPEAFYKIMQAGLDFVSGSNTLLTLGIRPTRPDTNYGYIQYLEEEEERQVFRVKTFTEKPNSEIAQRFLESGDFLWNSGMFLWNVDAITQAFMKCLPEVADIFEEGMDVYNTEKEVAFIEKAYSICPNISIDYGVMEKAENVFVLPSSFGWSDLGTWTSAWDNSQKDTHQNALRGANVMVYDSENTLVSAPNEKLVIVQGVKNLCIVDTKDALLIYRLNEEARLKEINGDVRRMKGEQYL